MSKLKIGVSGAPRGASFLAGMHAYGDRAQIVAVYEPDRRARDEFAAEAGVPALEHYDELLERVDAVIVASPQHHHVPQAVAALQRGVHVLSEVPAAVSLEQSRELLAAARASDRVYMMAENYCYSRPNLIVGAMARAGMFGELYFGEGEYLHEMKGWHTDSTGAPTWRHFWQVGRSGNTYPTHSLGPLLQWFDDRVVAVSCVGSGRHTDVEHEIDDTVVFSARTSRQALVRIRLDLLSNRPHLMDYYSLQGTEGAYEAPRATGQEPRVYVLGKSPSERWQSLDEYGDLLPSRYLEVAEGAGHWGADSFPVRDFIDAVQEGTPPPIDIYSALDMTLPGLVSEASFYQAGAWVAVPNPRLWDAGVGTEPGREAPLA